MSLTGHLSSRGPLLALGASFIGIIALSCALFTAPALEGRFLLVKSDSSELPVKLVELLISPDEPGPSGCWMMLTEGEFALNRADRTYSFVLVNRNSCTRYVLSSPGAAGRYDASGKDFVFHLPGGGPIVSAFSGHLQGDTLIVAYSGHIHYFKRAAGPDP